MTSRSGQLSKLLVRRRWSAVFGPNTSSGSVPSTRPSARWWTPPGPNTTSPTWNEHLLTVGHGDLESLTLQLRDEDPLLDDALVDFTGDLRPRGELARTIELSEGDSELEVRVEAEDDLTVRH